MKREIATCNLKYIYSDAERFNQLTSFNHFQTPFFTQSIELSHSSLTRDHSRPWINLFILTQKSSNSLEYTPISTLHQPPNNRSNLLRPLPIHMVIKSTLILESFHDINHVRIILILNQEDTQSSRFVGLDVVETVEEDFCEFGTFPGLDGVFCEKDY